MVHECQEMRDAGLRVKEFTFMAWHFNDDDGSDEEDGGGFCFFITLARN